MELLLQKRLGTATITVTSKDDESLSKIVTVKVGTPLEINESNLKEYEGYGTKHWVTWKPLNFYVDATEYMSGSAAYYTEIPLGYNAIYAEFSKFNGVGTCCFVGDGDLTKDDVWNLQQNAPIVGRRYIEAGNPKGELKIPVEYQSPKFIFHPGANGGKVDQVAWGKLLLIKD